MILHHETCTVQGVKVTMYLRVIACNSHTEMRVRDSRATRIFFLKNRMMQHPAQNITIQF